MTSTSTGRSLAIIGMAGKFPGARNVREFWENLRLGKESISFFSDEELLASGLDPALLRDQSIVKARGVLNDIEFFDAEFFGINPRDAEIMDPQQRLLLECAYEALEDAGYAGREHGGRRIGVFVGGGINSYLLNNLLSNAEKLAHIGHVQLRIANRPDNLALRTSFKLNLRGPSLTVQTNCSTSLVTVHMACQSLLLGECELALAGGVTINVPQVMVQSYEEGGIGSRDGHCRPFDSKAQGIVSGNGVGVVVLRRLEDAIANGDHIEAVILASAVNNDGALKVGYTAPSVE